LATGMVIVGFYCQLAAFALILNTALFTDAGSVAGLAAVALGPLFAILSVASYALAYGLWAHKHWAWTGATVALVALIGASVGLALVSTNMASAVAPSLGAALGIWYMHRPLIRDEILGGVSRIKATVAFNDNMGVAGPAR